MFYNMENPMSRELEEDLKNLEKIIVDVKEVESFCNKMILKLNGRVFWMYCYFCDGHLDFSLRKESGEEVIPGSEEHQTLIDAIKNFMFLETPNKYI